MLKRKYLERVLSTFGSLKYNYSKEKVDVTKWIHSQRAEHTQSCMIINYKTFILLDVILGSEARLHLRFRK